MNKIIIFMALPFTLLAFQNQFALKVDDALKTEESQGITTEQFVQKVLELAQETNLQSSKDIQKKLNLLELPTQVPMQIQESDMLVYTSPTILRLIQAFEKLHLCQFMNLLDRSIPHCSENDCFQKFKKRLIVKLSPWMLDRFIQRVKKKLEAESPFPGIDIDDNNEETLKENKALYEVFKEKKVLKPFISYLEQLKKKGFVTHSDIKELSEVLQDTRQRIDKIFTQSLLNGKELEAARKRLGSVKELIMQWLKRQSIKLEKLATC